MGDVDGNDLPPIQRKAELWLTVPMMALLLMCGAAQASDPDWILWPGESPYAQSYSEMNPSSARNVMRDGYPTHRVISIATRIHAPGKPYHNRPTQVLVDCSAQEFMYMYGGDPHKYIPIPLEAPEYLLWDYLCNKSQ